MDFIGAQPTDSVSKRLRMMTMNALLLPQIHLTKKLFFSFFCLSMMAVAEAGPIAAPIELKRGDTFRVIFVTSGKINAQSTNIADYDQFVNQQANGATYGGALIHFSAIASIATTATNPPSVNARDHINSGSNSQAIAGVFMVNGTKVATNSGTAANGLFSAAVLTDPNRGIDGTVYSGVNVWTGSSGNGLAYNTALFGYYGLGSTNDGRLLSAPNPAPYFPDPVAEVGYLGLTDPSGYGWLSKGGIPGVQATTSEFQMYAISNVLTVVPEPSSLIGCTLGTLILAVHHRFRRRSNGNVAN